MIPPDADLGDDWAYPGDIEAELLAEHRRYDREQRWAALRMLWGPAIVDQGATRRRRDSVICYERQRGEEWTLWRGIKASISIIIDRRHGQREVDRHRARTGKLYIESFDLGFWDSRSDGYGYSHGYLALYPGWRVEIGTDGESFM